MFTSIHTNRGTFLVNLVFARTVKRRHHRRRRRFFLECIRLTHEPQSTYLIIQFDAFWLISPTNSLSWMSDSNQPTERSSP